jgi:hypothetical protein
MISMHINRRITESDYYDLVEYSKKASNVFEGKRLY